MAVVALGLLGSGTSKSAATTLAVTNTTGAIIPAGTLIHVTGAWDNINSVTVPVITSSTIGGATATAGHATSPGFNITTTAGSGVWHQCFRALTTSNIAVGATIATLTSTQSALVRAASAHGWSGALSTMRGTMNNGGGAATASVTTSGTTPVSGDLVIGSAAYENNAQMTADADTLNGSWSTIVGINTTGGSAATNMGTGVQSKILTAGGAQTFNPTAGGGDVVVCVYTLQPAPVPAITQAAYRWYQEGTESGSTPYVAQDTAVTGNIGNGDATGTLRIRLQSTTAVDVPTTDDWQLQYDRNSSGSWLNVTAVSSAVATYDSPNLTNGEATTNRLTGGTGTFTAGKVSEDSLMDDLGWAGNNHTELVYALKVKAADLFDGEHLTFRVRRNNTTTEMTYSVTPRIDLIKPPPLVTQAAYRFYADGTQSGATALANQDTAPTVDVTSADANLGLRMLLQETNAGTVPATDDWQLQWEKNTSGTWVNVGATSEPAPGSHIVASPDSSTSLNLSGRTGAGQSFKGNGKNLTSAVFWLSKTGTPAATTATAYLYAHTGTYGLSSSGKGTGSPLATSTNTVAVSSLNTSNPPNTKYTFNFDGTFTLAKDTPYVILVDFGVTGDATHFVYVGYGGGSASGTAQFLAAGTWTGVSIDIAAEVYTPPSSVLPYDSPNLTDPVALAASYPISNYNTSTSLATTSVSVAQSFVGNGQPLAQAGFRLSIPSPTGYTGTYQAVVYASTGTYGSGLPTGSPLATSTTALAGGSLPTSGVMIYFDFDQSFTPTNGTPYWIGLLESGETAGKTVNFGIDTSSPTDPGQFAIFTTVWTAQASDAIYEVYSVSTLPTTSRLTGGSGSFAAGKVSRDGLVDDLGWSGSNHTEVLYALTLKQADLTNADTLKFRVLKNGATTGLTYTQTPTITVAKGAGGTTVNATVALTATSTLTTTGVPERAASVALTATSTLTATGTVTGAPVVEATVALTAASTLTATGTVTGAPVVTASVALTAVSTLSATGTVETPSGPPNSAPNPSFEVDLSEWQQAGGTAPNMTRVNTQAYHGDWSMLVHSNNPSAANVVIRSPATAGLIPVVPGEVWSVGIQCRWATGTPKLVRCDLRWMNAGGTEASSQPALGSLLSTNTSSWIQSKHEGFTAPADAVGIRARIIVNNAVNNDEFYLDACQIVEAATLPPFEEEGPPTVEATVALTATSTLTTDGTVEHFVPASVALTAVSTLTTAAVREPQASVSLVASSTLTTTAVVEKPATVGLTATSTLSTAGTVITPVQATVALTATSTLTSTAVRIPQASVSLTATSTLTATAVREVPATTSLTAISTLVATGTTVGQVPATVSLTATSTLTATALRTPQASVSLVAASTLVAGGVRVAPATVALSASSTLGATAVRVPVASVSLTATSTLTAAGIRTQEATAALTAASQLTTGALVSQLPVVALSAVSTLSATAVRIPQASVSLTASSTLTATALRTVPTTAALSATSTLVATASTVGLVTGAVALSASSTLSATALRTVPTSVALVAASSLTATAVRQPQAAVSMTAASSLTATGVRVRPATVALVSTSTLTTGAERIRPGAVSLTAASTLTATGTVIVPTGAAAALSAVSTLTAGAFRTQFAAVTLTATATLLTAGVRVQVVSVQLSASSSLTTGPVRIQPAQAPLITIATLGVSPVRVPQGAVALTALTVLTVTATVIVPGAGIPDVADTGHLHALDPDLSWYPVTAIS